jgi:hypothetical protein
VDGDYRIYPFSILSKKGVINDRFMGAPVVLFHGGQTVSVLDANTIEQSKSIGSATVFDPEVNGEVLTFTKSGERFTDNQTGSIWDITGWCQEGELKGTRLLIVPHANHFAFAWLAFFPDSDIYGITAPQE